MCQYARVGDAGTGESHKENGKEAFASSTVIMKKPDNAREKIHPGRKNNMGIEIDIAQEIEITWEYK